MNNANMPVIVQWCNDRGSFYFGYVFRNNDRTIIARCDEEEYHDVVRELAEEGYVIKS